MNLILANHKPLKFDSARRILLLGISSLLFCSALTAQENPWVAKPKGENPWATEDPKKEPSTEPTKTIETPETLPKEEAPIIKIDSAKVLPIKTEKPITLSATESQFVFNDRTIIVDKSNQYYKLRLKEEGKKLYASNAPLYGGILTGAVINVYSLPINIIGSFIPTHRTNSLIEQFEKDNPKATVQESRAVKRGINQRRLGKAMKGNLIGIGINIIALLIIFS
jgi:hypothetical protein